MALVLYGSAHSRTLRVLWLLTELELEFEHIPWGHDDPRLKTPEFLQLNPAGAIPTIVDDGFALSETMAIVHYLSRKHAHRGPPGFAPETPEGEADAMRWSLFAQGHIEPWVTKDALVQPALHTVRRQVGGIVGQALGVLDRKLGVTPWLGGEHFGVADLNVAGVLSPSRAAPLDFGPVPRVRAWLTQCYARDACQRARLALKDTTS